MAVEVLLMTDVDNVGVEGDVVSVADGFARNYLLPRKLAAEVTNATRRQLEKSRREREAAKEKEIQAARELAERIQQTSCTIPVKIGTEDAMFGSVTNKQIAEALALEGIEIDRHNIVMDEPIKELGVYDIRVKVHTEVDATMKVWVVEE